jgi:clan AA aspartic protease
MGEIRTKVKLSNAVDEALVSLGKLSAAEVRSIEVEGVVDTGAVASVLPVQIVQQLGLVIRGQRVAKFADGRSEAVDITGPVVFEILQRSTIVEALVLGDEVLIGQTVLEMLDLLADCAGRRVIVNPAHPNQPVLNVR